MQVPPRPERPSTPGRNMSGGDLGALVSTDLPRRASSVPYREGLPLLCQSHLRGVVFFPEDIAGSARHRSPSTGPTSAVLVSAATRPVRRGTYHQGRPIPKRIASVRHLVAPAVEPGAWYCVASYRCDTGQCYCPILRGSRPAILSRRCPLLLVLFVFAEIARLP